MSAVLDASALLAFLLGEKGQDIVLEALPNGVVGAANWAEAAQKVTAHGGDWAIATALIKSYGVSVEPVSRADAERAAAIWYAGSPLSLGDRLCLALADRLEAKVFTADHAWGESEQIIQIR